MRTSKLFRAAMLARSGVALSALLLSGAAFAQIAEPVRDPAAPGTDTQTSEEAEDSLDASEPVDSEGTTKEDPSQIVVTGTLVRGIAPPGTNVIGVTQGDVEATGATTTAQLLQTIPQLGSFNDLQVPVRGGGAVTANRPNLRSLPGFNSAGGSTTLVLMDGHRIVGTGIASTTPDPDIIPPGALERLEVVPDGGSAVYGSDAVAGVLNFITLKRFDGIKLEGHYGFADDYYQWDASATVGKDWGTGSAYVSYNYIEHDDIFGRDRDYVQQFPNPATGLLTLNCGAGNVQVGTRFFAPATTGATAAAITPVQCDSNDNSAFYPDERRHTALVSVSQEFGDRITGDLRAFYTNRKTIVRGGPFAATSNISNNVLNAIYPTRRTGFEVAPTPTSANPTVQTVFFEFGPQVTEFNLDLETYGLTPTITADLGGGWQMRLLGSYGRSDTETNVETFNTAGLTNAVNAGLFNPYDQSLSNPAVLAAILNNVTNSRTKQRLADARAVIDGELFELPGGGVKLAAGVEYARENFRTRSRENIIPGTLITGAPAVVINGVTIRALQPSTPVVDLKRTVKSAFGEIVIPIFGADNATTLLQELTFSVAGRYDDYSDVGGTFNPKFGITWRPVDWVKLRGSYGESFNAPSLADAPNATPFSTFFVGGSLFTPTPSLTMAGGGTLPNLNGRTSILAFRGNDPNIGPQTAKTLSVGLDVQPPFIEGLNLSATYFRIKLKGVIGLPPAQSPGQLYTEFLNSITFNPTAQQIADVIALSPNVPANQQGGNCTPQPDCIYAILNITKQNLGDFNLEGLDFNGSYHTDTSFGSLNFGVNANYELKREQSPAPGRPLLDTVEFNATRLKIRGSAGAEIGNLLAQVTVNHTGGYDLNPPIGFIGTVPAGNPFSGDVFTQQAKVDSFTTVNLFFRYDFEGEGWAKDLELTMNVDNLFDADPSVFIGPESGTPGDGIALGFNTLGRLIQFGISKRF